MTDTHPISEIHAQPVGTAVTVTLKSGECFNAERGPRLWMLIGELDASGKTRRRAGGTLVLHNLEDCVSFRLGHHADPAEAAPVDGAGPFVVFSETPRG